MIPGSFEIIVGKSMGGGKPTKRFGFVNTYDTKPKRRVYEVLRSQGMQMNQQVIFLSDGGDDVRNLQLYLNPYAEYLLDWFHITMRLTVLGQLAKGVALQTAPFQARQGQVLTLTAYHQMGGVQGALARHAEATFASLATEEHRSLARALFLCLVERGASDQNPTRRRVVPSELALNNPIMAALLNEVITVFTDARLLTTTSLDGKVIVEVSHEAIIRGYRRLASE